MKKASKKCLKEKKKKSITFLLNGRALNLGILDIISSSSSAELFTLTERTRWDVSNSGSFGLVNVSLAFIWIIEAASTWALHYNEEIRASDKKKDLILLHGSQNYWHVAVTGLWYLIGTSSSFLPLKQMAPLVLEHKSMKKKEKKKGTILN